MSKLSGMIRSVIPYTILREIDAAKINNAAYVNLDDIERVQSEIYYTKYGKHMNWDNPTTFSEKMMVSKIYGASEEKTKDTDKYEVRKKIETIIGKQYLFPLLGTYKRLSDVKLDDMPDSFVIKCTHDSHSVKIIKDKNKLTQKEWKKYVADIDHFYLKRKPYRIGYELHYAGIQPKIIIEQYMGENINDYKFLCFSGKPQYCWVDTNRFISHMRDYYDLEWNHMDFHNKYLPQNPELCKKPEHLEEMISLAEKLSEGYDQVRVDLYELNGRVYFGELTFTSDNGYQPLVPDIWDTNIGKLWDFNASMRIDARKKYNTVKEICRNW